MQKTEALIPPALAKIAAGRDHINTREFGRAVGKRDTTIRRAFCLNGRKHAYGVTPRKIGGALLWPVEQVAALLKGKTQ